MQIQDGASRGARPLLFPAALRARPLAGLPLPDLREPPDGRPRRRPDRLAVLGEVRDDLPVVGQVGRRRAPVGRLPGARQRRWPRRFPGAVRIAVEVGARRRAPLVADRHDVAEGVAYAAQAHRPPRDASARRREPDRAYVRQTVNKISYV